MRALVLFDRDDPWQAGQATALTLAEFGMDPQLDSGKRVPERLVWTAVSDATPGTDVTAATGEGPSAVGSSAGPASARRSAPGAAPGTVGVWTPKQLTFAGVAKPEAAAAVLAKAYDFVLNLHPRAFTPFDHLCAGANAHLRIARHDEATNPHDGAEVYDVMLRAAPERFVPELRAYLRRLNPTL